MTWTFADRPSFQMRHVFPDRQSFDLMFSRRAILSRSRDELHLSGGPQTSSPEPDQWFAKEKLYRDHIVEVLSKWDNIDDEIWAKASRVVFAGVLNTFSR